MKVLYLDLLPDYIPFIVQVKDNNGEKYDIGGGVDLNIFEDPSAQTSGAFGSAFGGAFDRDEMADSLSQIDILADAVDGDFGGGFGDGFQDLPIENIDSKTGLCGILVPKSILTADRHYRLRWLAEVDSVETAKSESFYACNSSEFKG